MLIDLEKNVDRQMKVVKQQILACESKLNTKNKILLDLQHRNNSRLRVVERGAIAAGNIYINVIKATYD